MLKPVIRCVKALSKLYIQYLCLSYVPCNVHLTVLHIFFCGGWHHTHTEGIFMVWPYKCSCSPSMYNLLRSNTSVVFMMLCVTCYICTFVNLYIYIISICICICICICFCICIFTDTCVQIVTMRASGVFMMLRVPSDICTWNCFYICAFV